MGIFITIIILVIVISVIFGVGQAPNNQKSKNENLKGYAEIKRKKLEDEEWERLEDLYDEHWDNYL